MRPVLALAAAGLALLFAFPAGAASHAPAVGAVSSADGSIRVRSGRLETILIGAGDAVLRRDTFITGPKSSCQIVFLDNSVLRISEKTSVTIQAKALSPKEGETLLAVHRGTVRVRAERLPRGRRFLVATPSAVVDVSGAEVVVHAGEDGETRVAVIRGRATIAGHEAKLAELTPGAAAGAFKVRGAAVKLAAGREISTSEGGARGQRFSALPPELSGVEFKVVSVAERVRLLLPIMRLLSEQDPMRAAVLTGILPSSIELRLHREARGNETRIGAGRRPELTGEDMYAGAVDLTTRGGVPMPVATLALVGGNVSLTRGLALTGPGVKAEPIRARTGTRLYAGDTVAVEDDASSCEVYYLDGSVTRLAKQSKLRIAQKSPADRGWKTILQLFEGTVSFSVPPKGKKAYHYIMTPKTILKLVGTRGKANAAGDAEITEGSAIQAAHSILFSADDRDYSVQELLAGILEAFKKGLFRTIKPAETASKAFEGFSDPTLLTDPVNRDQAITAIGDLVNAAIESGVPVEVLAEGLQTLPPEILSGIAGNLSALTLTQADDGTQTLALKIGNDDLTESATLTTNPDGSTVLTIEKTDGFGSTVISTETTSPDGTVQTQTTITNPDGGKTTIDQTVKPDGSGQLTVVDTTGDGQTTTTTLTLDSDGTQTIVTQNPDGSTSRVVIDPDGNIVTAADPAITNPLATGPNPALLILDQIEKKLDLELLPQDVSPP